MEILATCHNFLVLVTSVDINLTYSLAQAHIGAQGCRNAGENIFPLKFWRMKVRGKVYGSYIATVR